MAETTSWDHLAQIDARGAISTSSRGRDEQVFWDSGERTAAFILSHVAPHLDRRAVAVDIGAGIGRIAIPIAQQFERVRAIDVADAMLEQLRSACARFGVTNIEPYRATDRWDAEPANFVYSVLTFQHIEHLPAIEAYVSRIARCLRGVAFLQFDTRPRTFAARVKEQLPDWSVPWTWRRGMRRYRRDPAILRDAFARERLRIVHELDPGTALHAFILELEDRVCGGCAPSALLNTLS